MSSGIKTNLVEKKCITRLVEKVLLSLPYTAGNFTFYRLCEEVADYVMYANHKYSFFHCGQSSEYTLNIRLYIIALSICCYAHVDTINCHLIEIKTESEYTSTPWLMSHHLI